LCARTRHLRVLCPGREDVEYIFLKLACLCRLALRKYETCTVHVMEESWRAHQIHKNLITMRFLCIWCARIRCLCTLRLDDSHHKSISFSLQEYFLFSSSPPTGGLQENNIVCIYD